MALEWKHEDQGRVHVAKMRRAPYMSIERLSQRRWLLKIAGGHVHDFTREQTFTTLKAAKSAAELVAHAHG